VGGGGGGGGKGACYNKIITTTTFWQRYLLNYFEVLGKQFYMKNVSGSRHQQQQQQQQRTNDSPKIRLSSLSIWGLMCRTNVIN